MRIGAAAALELAIGMTIANPMATAKPRPERVEQTIFVHDVAGIAPSTLEEALEEVARIYSTANVNMRWLYCRAETGGAMVDCPALQPNAVVLRIIPGPLKIVSKWALGFSLVDENGGTQAAVSLLHVKMCVARQKLIQVSLSRVLGHAMAHEVGHLLLGTNSHSSAGLMQADWDDAAMNRIANGALNFTAAESERIRASVMRRTPGFLASR